METTSKKPIDKVKFGAVTAAIWENEGDNGPWFNVTLSRTYRDKNDSLRDSSSLTGNDILAGAEALRQAYLRIHELRTASKSDGAA